MGTHPLHLQGGSTGPSGDNLYGIEGSIFEKALIKTSLTCLDDKALVVVDGCNVKLIITNLEKDILPALKTISAFCHPELLH